MRLSLAEEAYAVYSGYCPHPGKVDNRGIIKAVYIYIYIYMDDCQNYGPFLGPLNYAPYYNKDPKRDHNFENPPYVYMQ